MMSSLGTAVILKAVREPAIPDPRTSAVEVSEARSSRGSGNGVGQELAIQALLWALKPLVNLRGSMPLPYVTTFLMVALGEGEGVCSYARMSGISRAAMSRHLRDIGDRARNGGPGLGLVTIERHPDDSRRRQVF
jgi:hypothetical protein